MIIIKKNKNIIKLLANTILSEFLREIVIFNIILLVKNKEIIAKKVLLSTMAIICY